MGEVGVVVVPWHDASLTARDAIHTERTAKAAVMKKSRSMSTSTAMPWRSAIPVRVIAGRSARSRAMLINRHGSAQAGTPLTQAQ
jgi:hypothetical protein